MSSSSSEHQGFYGICTLLDIIPDGEFYAFTFRFESRELMVTYILNSFEMKKIFVTCAKGFEPLLLKEIKSLGFSSVDPQFRGVQLNLQEEQIEEAVYTLNYCSRIGVRVLVPVLQ